MIRTKNRNYHLSSTSTIPNMPFQSVDVNVSGTRFTLSKITWERILDKMADKSRLHEINSNEIFLEGHPDAFQAILYYHQAGELHIPVTLCPSSFQKELQMYGTLPTSLSKCCFAKYVTYFDDNEVLQVLECDEDRRLAETTRLKAVTKQGGWKGIKSWTNLVMNEPFYSRTSRVYFIISSIIIIVSLATLIAGTHPLFQRDLNEEEWKTYFGDKWQSIKHQFATEDGKDIHEQGFIGANVETNAIPEGKWEGGPLGETEIGAIPDSVAENTDELDAEPEKEQGTDIGVEKKIDSGSDVQPETKEEPPLESNVVSDIADATGESEAVRSTAEVKDDNMENVNTTDDEPETNPKTFLESEPAAKNDSTGNSETEQEPVALPENAYVRFSFMEYIEYVCVAFFTIDLLVRYIFCVNLKELLTSFLHWVDVFSLLVMYTRYTFEQLNPKEKYEASFVDMIHCLQVVRVFRLFRLVRNYLGFRVLLYAFKASFKELLLMSMFLVVGMLIFSTLAFFSGDPVFTNIPVSCWWSIVTMTTVGYGDMVPSTALSRLIGIVCAISGICLLAVIIPIFVNYFVMFYNYTKVLGKRFENICPDKNAIEEATVDVVNEQKGSS